MAHIVSMLGRCLRDMLLADGWNLEWERAGKCHLSKDGHHRGFPLNAVIPVGLVKSIAETAGWDTKRFEELRHQFIPAEKTSVEEKGRTNQPLQ